MKKNYILLLLLLIVLLAKEVKTQDEMFKGGVGDGYVQTSYLDSTNSMQKGGVSDGYAMTLFQTGTHSLSQGGVGDGYEKAFFETGIHSLSQGGVDDGYASDSFIKMHWTGRLSSAWLQPENWSLNRSPVSTDHVVIPGGRANYPQLGAQHMIVGETNLTAAYLCSTLQIKQNGFLTGNLNSTITNYSGVKIRGTLRWKNLSPEAWINHPGSEILINDGGILSFDSN
jgi:hypothetical protein